MATVTNWIDHLNKPAEEVAGAIYPGAGSVEGILVIIALVLWVGWHVLTAKAFAVKTCQPTHKTNAMITSMPSTDPAPG